MIRSSTGSPAVAAWGNQRAVGDLRPYGPYAETPDEDGTKGRLRGTQSVGESSSPTRSQPFLPEQSLLEPQLDRVLRSVPARYGRQLPSVGPISVNRLPHAASRHSIAAHVCCQIAAENCRKPFVRTSKLQA
jgi:hypothetical protein